MPFCHNLRNFVSKVVSTRRNISTREEEACKTITRRHEKKREFEKEVYKNKKTSKPYTHLS